MGIPEREEGSNSWIALDAEENDARRVGSRLSAIHIPSAFGPCTNSASVGRALSPYENSGFQVNVCRYDAVRSLLHRELGPTACRRRPAPHHHARRRDTTAGGEPFARASHRASRERDPRVAAVSVSASARREDRTTPSGQVEARRDPTRAWRAAGVALAAAATLSAAAAPIAFAESEFYIEDIPQGLSSGEKASPASGPLSRDQHEIEKCTGKCVVMCTRGGGGAPGLGPLSVRKAPVVFKEGFRSRQYCLSECAEICSITVNGSRPGR